MSWFSEGGMWLTDSWGLPCPCENDGDLFLWQRPPLHRCCLLFRSSPHDVSCVLPCWMGLMAFFVVLSKVQAQLRVNKRGGFIQGPHTWNCILHYGLCRISMRLVKIIGPWRPHVCKSHLITWQSSHSLVTCLAWTPGPVALDETWPPL